MGSPIKINSISIDLANEIDMAKCDHFSIREFVNETRKRDVKKCWPFSKESIGLANQESYSLPSLLAPKYRWWRCMSCIKDIDADGTKDCGLQSNSRAISEKKLEGNSSVIPSKSKSLTAIDHERGKQTDIAGNDVVEENADKRSQKDDQTAAVFIKKVHPRATDASTVRSNKSRKVASPVQAGNKRSKEAVNKTSTDIRSRKEKQNGDDQAVTTFGSSEIAGVVEDTPPKANKNHKGSRVQVEFVSLALECANLGKRKRTRKISDLLNEDKTKTSEGSGSGVRKEQPSSKKESIRGRKRKLLTENNNVSNGEAAVNADSEKSESNESEFDGVPIQGKLKNRRFQVVDELPSETSPDGIRENHADAGKSTLPTTPVNSLRKEKDSAPCTQTTQRTEKQLSIPRKKKNKTVTDNGKSTVISFSSGMDGGNQVKPPNGPFLNAISQSTRDLLNEKRAASSLLDERLASEGYFRKQIPQPKDKPPVSLHLQQDSDHLRSRAAETNRRDFGSSSKSVIGEWLRNGVGAVNFSSNNNNTTRSSFPNFELRPSSTNVADRSRVPQKDACVADRKGKAVMVQEDYEAPGSQSQYIYDNSPDDQNDDIPMEIVELMAKNQYERCLPDKEEDISNKQTSQETAHKSKNALLIDLNETYDNGNSLEDNTARPLKPSDINARKDEHFPIGKQQKSLDFFPRSQPYVPSPYFPPTLENRAGSFRFSGLQTQNCHWIGNGPTTMASQNPSPPGLRMLRPCDTCQSVPHQYAESSYPYWSSSTPMRAHHRPVSFGMNQPTNLGMLSQPSSSANTWNLNFGAANRKPTFAPNSELSFGCKHTAGVNHSRPVNAFSNDNSAMRLLSLMDPRVTSNTPADHHETTKSTRSPFWPVNKSGIQTGNSSKTAYPTNQPPFDFNRSRFAPETSRRNFPIIPPIGTPSLSFQNALASWNHHHQDKKMKRKEAFAPVYNSHERPVFASNNNNNNNNQGKFQLLGASNSMMLPLKYHLTDKEKKQKRKAESSSSAAVLPPRNAAGQIECSINRNPADFTIAEPGNVYMLTGEQLKVRKRTNLRKKDVSKQTKKPVGPLP